MGRLPQVSPGEARLGAIAMLCLTAMAVAAAAVVYGTGAFEMSALFVLLACVGAWQVAYFWRHK